MAQPNSDDLEAVSYTHLDVYKRQVLEHAVGGFLQPAFAVEFGASWGADGEMCIRDSFFTFPLIFMIVSSFKGSNQQIFGDLRSLRAFLPVGDLTTANYDRVFTDSNFPRYMLNSIVITAGTIGLSLLVNSMTAYALSRLRWPGQKLVLSVIIATLIIPGMATVMPMLLLVSRLPGLSFDEGLTMTQGWLDTYTCLLYTSRCV